ncbi:hypothetical protein DPMN_015187 [Dreissena polymorpha]|uniref:Uncharacterized protein n=1 Tax=Dreissena polymorpha TaxID=45954 RepID=A0A9D4NAW2_DREPO|nr:hypothetical protein DPMN_015187 [Dreissena polymorpha]
MIFSNSFQTSYFWHSFAAIYCTSALIHGLSNYSPYNHVIQGDADETLKHFSLQNGIVDLITRHVNIRKRSIEAHTVKAVEKTNSYTDETFICNQSRAIFSDNQTPVCPKTVSEGQSDPLNKRSTCPWDYVVDHDPERFPATILKARSACTTCIGNSLNECNAITQLMTVIIRRRLPGAADEYTSEKVQIDVPVAFTCAGRRLAPSSDSHKQDENVDYA